MKQPLRTLTIEGGHPPGAGRRAVWLRPVLVAVAALAIALVAVLLVRPGSALAQAAQQFTDDTTADFGQGTPDGNTTVSPTAGDGNGAVTLNPTGFNEEFDGTSLPNGWFQSAWQSGGTAAVANGLLTVNGACAGTGSANGTTNCQAAGGTFPRGETLDFTSTFGADSFEHVGFATDFGNDNSAASNSWAMISTKDTTNQLFARTNDGSGAAGCGIDTLIPGVAPGESHNYRIEWTATGVPATGVVNYYVDNFTTPVVTHSTCVPAIDLRVGASDFNNNPTALTVGSVKLSSYPNSPGVFQSRVFDTGAGNQADLGTLTADLQKPVNTDVVCAVRSGDTPRPMPRGLRLRRSTAQAGRSQVPSTARGTASTRPHSLAAMCWLPRLSIRLS